ncbi:ribose-phosphate diphosphokinase, partial [Desulfosarcina sp. OttesenSCG-928-B08]|nr:ribose-phosphate diphosphokinase [Desulfosarcina sp. OttesenSCG-928-B08]
RAVAKRLNAALAIVDKRRSGPNKSSAMAIIGDVTGKTAILYDDMVDTAGTITEAASAILKQGAKVVHAFCVHAVLSGPALERIDGSSLSSVVCTDTIPLTDKVDKCGKIKVLSIANLVGEAIIRSYTGASVTSLFV